MKIDTGIMGTDLNDVAERAREAEAQGYDGGLTAETAHDPFFPILLAAQATERIELGTGIAVAFARNPMTMANIGYDLQQFSEGRFILGLGSQIRAHIERRFSMPWSHPAARMREFVLAMRAIWASWNDGEKLDFRGEHYQHTLMTPFFDPGPNPFGSPKVFLAAVGEKMTEVAGEACDGIILHGFTTERYVREVTLPALERGLERGGRARSDVEVTASVFVAMSDAEWEAARTRVAFYGSTPGYRHVLDHHGLGALFEALHERSRAGEWAEMTALVDDDVLALFVARASEPAALAAAVRDRVGGLADRVCMVADTADPAALAPAAAALST